MSLQFYWWGKGRRVYGCNENCFNSSKTSWNCSLIPDVNKMLACFDVAPSECNGIHTQPHYTCPTHTIPSNGHTGWSTKLTNRGDDSCLLSKLVIVEFPNSQELICCCCCTKAVGTQNQADGKTLCGLFLCLCLRMCRLSSVYLGTDNNCHFSGFTDAMFSIMTSLW